VVGGTLYFVGLLLFAWNVWKTANPGRAQSAA
jgi:cbb3-type cytochrome oxidase subunit 1